MAVARARAAVEHAMKVFSISQRRVCRALGIARASVRYRAKRPDADRPLVLELHRLSELHPRWGYRKITALLHRDGWRVNRKRVERLWRLHGLRVPQQAVKRRRAGPQVPGKDRYRARFTHQVWAVDILHDATADGRGACGS